MATKTIDVPSGMVEVVLLLPATRLQDVIDTYAHQGGYNPVVDGSDKATFAKRALAASIDQLVVSYKASIAVATQAVDQKITTL